MYRCVFISSLAPRCYPLLSLLFPNLFFKRELLFSPYPPLERRRACVGVLEKLVYSLNHENTIFYFQCIIYCTLNYISVANFKVYLFIIVKEPQNNLTYTPFVRHYNTSFC